MKCPGCDLELDEDDLAAQARHMDAAHPEIIKERRREAARWDGWEDEHTLDVVSEYGEYVRLDCSTHPDCGHFQWRWRGAASWDEPSMMWVTQRKLRKAAFARWSP